MMENGFRQRIERFKRPNVGAAVELQNLGVIGIGHPWIDRISLYSSWLLIGFVFLVTILPFPGKGSWNIKNIFLTMFLYFLYVIGLEIFSRSSPATYDRFLSRVFRILANIAVITLLIYFSPGSESYFWCLYAFPLFQANIYFRSAGVVTVVAVTLGVYWSSSLAFSNSAGRDVESYPLLLTHSLMLLLLAAILRWLFSAARESRRVEYEIASLMQDMHLDIVSQVNEEELLRKIIRHGVEILQGKGGGIYEYHADRGELTVVADWGGKQSIKGHTLRKGEGMAGRVVEHGQPMIVRDYATWPLRCPDIESDLFHAVVEVPLAHSGRIIGVLYVTDDEKRRSFRARDADVLSQLAKHAAITIANVKTYEQSKRSIAQLELLNEITERITHATSLKEILEVTLQEALKTVNTSDGSIMIFDPTINELEIKAWIVNGRIRDPKSHKSFGITEGIAGHVAATLTAYNCKDSLTDEHYSASETGRPLRSILSVPIVSNRKLHFIINADSKEPNRFTDANMELFSNLGGHAATILESLRLKEFGLSLSSLSLEELHAKIVESAYRLVGAEVIALFVKREDGKVILVAAYPPTEESNVDRDGLIMQILASCKHEIIRDAELDERVDPCLRQLEMKSLLGVPLVVRLNPDSDDAFESIGVLIAGTKKECEFSTREKQVLASLATQAAVAIMQARLHDKVLSERDYQQSLLASALDAIIAIDEEGLIKEFNPTAERILGYSKSELRGKSVSILYEGGLQAAKKVMRRLRKEKPQGRLINYFTHARHKNGEAISVRLSAMIVKGGSVGFFRDQAEIENMRRHIQNLTAQFITRQAISQPDDLSKILETIARKAQGTLDADVVWVYYYDQAKAELRPPVKVGSAEGTESAEADLLPHLADMIKGSAIYFTETGQADNGIAGAFAQIENVSSVVAGPLRIWDNTVGFILCGYKKLIRFEGEEQLMAHLFISDAAIVIDHAREREAVTNLIDGLMSAFYKESLNLTTELSFEPALQNLLERAVSYTNAEYGALGIMGPTKEIKPFIHSGLDDHVVSGLTPPTGHGLLGNLLEKDDTINEIDVREYPNFRGWDEMHPDITSFLGKSITLKSEPVGNIYLGNKKGGTRFSSHDENFLAIIANLVSLTIKSFRDRQEIATDVALTIALVLLSQLAVVAKKKGALMAAELERLRDVFPTGTHLEVFSRLIVEARELDAEILGFQAGIEKRRSELVPIDSVLRDVLRDIDDVESKAQVEVYFDPACLVRGNKLLLYLACSIMIDNAVWAIEKARRPGRITITSEIRSGHVICRIKDNGCGISVPDLFVKPEKGESSYIVGIVMRLHEGDVSVKHTGADGTTIEFWLPESTY